ncbi:MULTISPECIES: hypothetical protein, partial [unclassified Pseudoalteromonas]|uniref:hypothetical protein n=1 Tax=unclassified Pseudoalteromonas TaxID=194690 RepID=UPI001C71928A
RLQAKAALIFKSKLRVYLSVVDAELVRVRSERSEQNIYELRSLRQQAARLQAKPSLIFKSKHRVYLSVVDAELARVRS